MIMYMLENGKIIIPLAGGKNMNPGKLIKLMSVLENLKSNLRHSWTSKGRQESVAEHSWRLALLACFVKDEFPEADINKVILMCLFHDLGEAITGDIPAFIKTEEDEVVESQVVSSFLDTLPELYKKELSELFLEMNELKTEESKIFKALDKMEALIQHNEADLSTWIPLEYEANMVYGADEVEFSPYMKRLKKSINDDCLKKINE